MESYYFTKPSSTMHVCKLILMKEFYIYIPEILNPYCSVLFCVLNISVI